MAARRMCLWRLSPGDPEETACMFFTLARYPAVVMQKAPHSAGLFWWAGFGEGGGPSPVCPYAKISRRP